MDISNELVKILRTKKKRGQNLVLGNNMHCFLLFFLEIYGGVLLYGGISAYGWIPLHCGKPCSDVTCTRVVQNCPYSCNLLNTKVSLWGKNLHLNHFSYKKFMCDDDVETISVFSLLFLISTHSLLSFLSYGIVLKTKLGAVSKATSWHIHVYFL